MRPFHAALAALALAACAVHPTSSAGADPAPSAGADTAAPAARAILPASTDFVLANGMRVFLVADHEVPLVGFALRFTGGTVEDPPGKEGTAALLAALLDKGAGDRDRERFQEDVEFVGGQFAASPAPRWLSLSAEFLKGDADLALELVGDAARRPRLDEAEFDKAKRMALDGLAVARQQPQQLMGRYWANWMFPGHPYARPYSGDEASVASLTLADVRAAAARLLAPQRAWLAVAGDFDPAEMRREIEARFGDWRPGESAAAPVPAPAATAGGSVLLVDKPDALQTYLQFGNLAFDRRDPDHAARSLANCLLGERFTSRLNIVLRTQRGFTYGAYSVFDDTRNGLFWVGTRGTAVATTAECLPLAESLYRTFVAEGITAEELASTKTYLKGQYGPGFETGAQQAAAILDLEFDGLPRDHVDGFLARIDALTLDDVNRVVRERFPQRLDWVVIGPAETCRPIVARFGKVTECRVTDPGFGPPRPR